MNKERYLKLKKDFIVLYLARNGIMTFLITLFTFSLDLSNYYQISFPATIPYIFFNNIFTLMYFCLLWIFNYLLFELFKIINDWYDDNLMDDICNHGYFTCYYTNCSIANIISYRCLFDVWIYDFTFIETNI